jgi:hypothetical protein
MPGSLAHAAERGQGPVRRQPLYSGWGAASNQLDQGLAFGHRRVFADEPFGNAARPFGHDRYMHLHGFDDANLGIDLNAITDLDEAGDEVSCNGRSDLA